MIRECPSCGSKSIIVIGKVFRCKKCGYLNKPTDKNGKR